MLSPPLPTVSRPAEQQCSIGGGLCSARHPKLLFQRAQFRPHLNEGGHRRCLRPPPRSILSSSSAAVLEWRRTLPSPPLPTVQRCSPASHPAVPPCTMRAHLTPPPLPTTRRCSSASRLAVQQCHCAQCEPTEESKHGAMSSFPKQYCFALFYPEYEF